MTPWPRNQKRETTKRREENETNYFDPWQTVLFFLYMNELSMLHTHLKAEYFVSMIYVCALIAVQCYISSAYFPLYLLFEPKKNLSICLRSE